MASNQLLIMIKCCAYSNFSLLLEEIWHTYVYFFKNILDKVMRKAINCKIPVQKRPNYIIKSNLKFGIIFLKSWTSVSNYLYSKIIYQS